MGPKKKMTREEILLKKRLRERERYKKMKQDPILQAEMKEKERMKYAQKKKKKQVKAAKDMTTRELRQKRKQWKVNSKAYYKRKTNPSSFAATTPPESPTERNHQQDNVQRNSAKKRVKRDRSKIIQRNKKLQEVNKDLKRNVDKWKQRYYRLRKDKSVVLSPRANAIQIFKSKDKQLIQRKLVFGEALTTQLKINLSKIQCPKKKYSYVSNLIGDKNVLKKYKLMKDVINAFPSHTCKYSNNSVMKLKEKSQINALKEAVKEFLENDSNTRHAPGKKDTITRKKRKMQKRYLNDSMKNLHRKFVKETETKISYALFCRLRPFYVVHQKLDGRDTCLCKLCSNTEYMINSLHKNKIINERFANDCVHHLTCEAKSVKCYLRQCDGCVDKQMNFNEFDGNAIIHYEKWDTKKEKYKDKSGKVKETTLTIKVRVEQSALEVVNKLEEQMLKYLKHKGNIMNQFTSIKLLKTQMKDDEVLVHMDFSENYNLKYHSEVQSFHFGGSRKQVSLHTVVLYYKNSIYEDTKNKLFCTISENLSHGPQAILGHLQPIFQFINDKKPNLRAIHFLSDGPSSQYRNKLMFQLFPKEIQKYFSNVQSTTWNYLEAGHGKGAPDGIGAVVKRTADSLVSQGKDISSFEIFTRELKNNVRSVQIDVITKDNINSMMNNINTANIKPFKGTMQVHQVVVQFNEDAHLTAQMKTLSCFKCPVMKKCNHFNIGSMIIRKEPTKEKKTEAKEKKTDTSIKLSSYVIVNYEGEFFPGIVEGINNEEYIINTMCMSGPSHWKWPEKKDTCTYTINDIVETIDVPMMVNVRGTMSVPEIDKWRK